jgi:hypothetical protein
MGSLPRAQRRRIYDTLGPVGPTAGPRKGHGHGSHRSLSLEIVCFRPRFFRLHRAAFRGPLTGEAHEKGHQAPEEKDKGEYQPHANG